MDSKQHRGLRRQPGRRHHRGDERWRRERELLDVVAADERALQERDFTQRVVPLLVGKHSSSPGTGLSLGSVV